MRMTMATSSTMASRIYRKGFRIPSKKHPGKALPGKLHSLQRVCLKTLFICLENSFNPFISFYLIFI